MPHICTYATIYVCACVCVVYTHTHTHTKLGKGQWVWMSHQRGFLEEVTTKQKYKRWERTSHVVIWARASHPEEISGLKALRWKGSYRAFMLWQKIIMMMSVECFFLKFLDYSKLLSASACSVPLLDHSCPCSHLNDPLFFRFQSKHSFSEKCSLTIQSKEGPPCGFLWRHLLLPSRSLYIVFIRVHKANRRL